MYPLSTVLSILLIPSMCVGTDITNANQTFPAMSSALPLWMGPEEFMNPTVPQPRSDARPIHCGKDFYIKCTFGECCSAEGWCGNTSAHCTVPQNCQRNYGVCDSDTMPVGLLGKSFTLLRLQVGNVPYGQLITRCTRPRVVAITYDDSPSEHTDQIKDYLYARNARGTFFVNGNTNGKGPIDATDRWHQIIRSMYLEGHQVASHGWSHHDLDTMTRSGRLSEMVYNDIALDSILQRRVTYMRPPYMNCTHASGCMSDMTTLGLHVVGYEVDSRDTEGVDLTTMRKTIDAAFQAKGPDESMMIIVHDTSEHVVNLTEHIIDRAHEKGWQVVTLGDCLNDPVNNWYATDDGERHRLCSLAAKVAMADPRAWFWTFCVVGFVGVFSVGSFL